MGAADEIRRSLQRAEAVSQEREDLPPVSLSPVEAVLAAAAREGLAMRAEQAAAIVRTLFAWHEGEIRSVQLATPDHWRITGFRDHLRRRMRHALLEKVIEEGSLMTALPREEIRDPVSTPLYLSSGNNIEAWSYAITMSVPVRRAL